MTNAVLPSVYDEHIGRLALGVELIDAVRGTRIHRPIRVTLAECPRPLHEWRVWPRGTSLDDVLARMPRHDTGRYARLYDAATPGVVHVRVSDPRREFVARRLAITIPSAAAVAAADIPITRRAVTIAMHPGASGGGGTTAIRATVTGASGDPVRWARVRAAHFPTGEILGSGHGDDRGEVVVPLARATNAVGLLDDPVRVRLTIGVPPTAAPPLTDPLVPVVDALWDLPEEIVTLPTTPPGSPLHGRDIPASYLTSTILAPITVAHGRIVAVTVTV